MNTISDEKCDKAMYDAISIKDDISFMYGEDKVGEMQDNDDVLVAYTWLLTDEDKDLLIEYAPKLFNTMASVDYLDGACLELASMVGYYRMSINKKNHRKEHNERLSDTSRDKEKSLKTHIKGVLDIVGDYKHPYKYDVRNELLEWLRMAYLNPKLFITEKQSEIIPTKTPIENYLKSLNLPGKSNVIREFKNKINTNSTPAFIQI